MTDDFDFVNTTAQELVDLLVLRAEQRLSPKSDYWAAVSGAALTLLAEVLRQQAMQASNPRAAADELINHYARWLRELLKPVTGQT